MISEVTAGSKEVQRKSAKPQLHHDVLVSISEKIFFSPDNEFRMDLRKFDLLNFMFASSLCEKSTFFQFRRMTKICISSVDLELSCPLPIEGRFARKRQFFQGPFNVGDWLFIMLLQKGVLRLKTLEAFYSFDRNIYDEFYTNQDELPIESLVKLFLFKGSPQGLEKVSLSDLQDCQLDLDSVKVTDNANVFAHFDRIINLNAVDVFVEFVVSFGECIDFAAPRLYADRVKHVTLIYSVDVNSPADDIKGFSFSHLRTMVDFVTASCPNLERLYVRFSLGGEFSENDFRILSHWLCESIEKLASETLYDLDCKCELTVAFRAFFPLTTLVRAGDNHHKLTQIGVKKIFFDDDELPGEEDAISSATSGGRNNSCVLYNCSIGESRFKQN